MYNFHGLTFKQHVNITHKTKMEQIVTSSFHMDMHNLILVTMSSSLCLSLNSIKMKLKKSSCKK